MRREASAMELTEIVQKMKSRDFAGYCTPGCGSLLGLKLVVQNMQKFILVNSPGCVSGSSRAFGMPYVNLGMNAAAAAGSISRVSSEAVVAYSGDWATSMHISSLAEACLRNDRFIYVCYNNSLTRDVIKSVAPHARYAATASVAYPDDFIEKLTKALPMDGVRFIELLAPCPASGNFDPSNTIEAARLATETALWPVFEVEGKKVTLTRRPLRMEPVSAYYACLKKQMKEDEMEKIQDRTNKNWKSLSEGKLI